MLQQVARKAAGGHGIRKRFSRMLNHAKIYLPERAQAVREGQIQATHFPHTQLL